MKRKELLRKIRAANLDYWASYLGRSVLGKKVGDDECNHLNQLIGEHGSFGDKVAEKYEEALGLPPLWLDTPHPGLWKEKYREEIMPHISSASLAKRLIDTVSEREKQSIKEFLESALKMVDDNKTQNM